MKEFALKSKGRLIDQFENRSEHDSYDDAIKVAGAIFDSDDEGDFRIVENATRRGYLLRGYTFCKEPCPECGKEARTRDKERTVDCHGPFRRVCPDCYDRIMSDRGFDGEEYTAADERLDCDY